MACAVAQLCWQHFVPSIRDYWTELVMARFSSFSSVWRAFQANHKPNRQFALGSNYVIIGSVYVQTGLNQRV